MAFPAASKAATTAGIRKRNGCHDWRMWESRGENSTSRRRCDSTTPFFNISTGKRR